MQHRIGLLEIYIKSSAPNVDVEKCSPFRNTSNRVVTMILIQFVQTLHWTSPTRSRKKQNKTTTTKTTTTNQNKTKTKTNKQKQNKNNNTRIVCNHLHLLLPVWWQF